MLISKKDAIKSGLTHYFTGSSCKRGHVCQRYTKNGMCIMCSSLVREDWRNKNRERTRELRRIWAKNNPEKERESHTKSNKKWWNNAKDSINKKRKKIYLENIESCREYSRITSRIYRENHKSDYTEHVKNWRKRNPEKNRELERKIYKKWASANPEAVRAKSSTKRIRRITTGKHSGEDIKRIYKLQTGKCAYCKESVGKKYHVDHITPICIGGTNYSSNLQILCPTCNLTKGAKHPLDFARERGLLL